MAGNMVAAGNVASMRHIRQAGEQLARLAMAHPCHMLVRPSRVRAGTVVDAVAPLDTDTRQAAREHYRAGGIVRLHARRPAELDAARLEITQ